MSFFIQWIVGYLDNSIILSIFVRKSATMSRYTYWMDNFKWRLWCGYIFLPICGTVYVHRHVFYMYCSCSNKSQWLEDWTIQTQKSLCVMHEMKFMCRNVCFANCLYCIKWWVIKQYASGYMDCRLFSVLYILLVHCHHYQTYLTILHTYTVWYSYITVGVGYVIC